LLKHYVLDPADVRFRKFCPECGMMDHIGWSHGPRMATEDDMITISTTCPGCRLDDSTEVPVPDFAEVLDGACWQDDVPDFAAWLKGGDSTRSVFRFGEGRVVRMKPRLSARHGTAEAPSRPDPDLYQAHTERLVREGIESRVEPRTEAPTEDRRPIYFDGQHPSDLIGAGDVE